MKKDLEAIKRRTKRGEAWLIPPEQARLIKASLILKGISYKDVASAGQISTSGVSNTINGHHKSMHTVRVLEKLLDMPIAGNKNRK